MSVSERVARIAATSIAQFGLIAGCLAWFGLGLSATLLTAALSILAITLAQMVLATQFDRERDADERAEEARRRDIALHVKLDELVVATSGARDEIAGIEEQTEDAIAEARR